MPTQVEVSNKGLTSLLFELITYLGTLINHYYVYVGTKFSIR